MSALKANTFPAVNNPAVFRSGRSTFTMKHPTASSNLMVPTTISTASIFELFDYHDAILQLQDTSKELQPEPFAWDKFTAFWNCHAADDGPRFVTWDVETRLYLRPLRVVTLVDFGLMRRIPKIASDIAKPPHVEVNAAPTTSVPSNASKVSHSHSVAATSTSTTTTTTSSGSASIIDFLPADITGELVTTGLVSWIRQEAQKAKYYKQRDQERKAKDASTRTEKKKKKKLALKGKVPARGSIDTTPSSTEDVTMSDVVDINQPSSSKTTGA